MSDVGRINRYFDLRTVKDYKTATGLWTVIKRLFPHESFIRKLPGSPRGKMVQGNVEARCVAGQKL